MVRTVLTLGALAAGAALAWRWWVESPAQRQTHVPVGLKREVRVVNLPIPFNSITYEQLQAWIDLDVKERP
jgi:hypothetical protein